MIKIDPEILEKHAIAIEAARKYYVLGERTGFSDGYYDLLERKAREDGLELRDYVCQEIQGKRSSNADYIGKVEKLAVTGNMEEAFLSYMEERPEIEFAIPKYDGSSLAAYYDVSTGRCVKVVTIGGSNLGSEGIDQTEKLAKYFPDLSNTGICALQAECLVSLEHGFGESSRQKANGIINASYEPLTYDEFISNSTKERDERDYELYLEKFSKNLEKVKKQVDDYVNIRAFRYFRVPTEYPSIIDGMSYKEVLDCLPKIKNKAGDIKFSGGFVFDPKKDHGDFMNRDIWETSTGTFLVDGVVGYSYDGFCIKALKYKDAGRGESTIVRELKWNNQVSKGKDAWSCNAIIDPINIRGEEVKKPTAGSIKKMVENGLSAGARVTIILANSTIPKVSEVIEPGNRDYQWPTCSCGYQMSERDIFGIRLKCGNPNCTERYERMRAYLSKTGLNFSLTKLLVVDGVTWEDKLSNYDEVLNIVDSSDSPERLYEYLASRLTTDLQRKNLALVINPAFAAIKELLNERRAI